jgi:hypothetical protein
VAYGKDKLQTGTNSEEDPKIKELEWLNLVNGLYTNYPRGGLGRVSPFPASRLRRRLQARDRDSAPRGGGFFEF